MSTAMEPIPNSLQLDKNHPESSAKFQQNSNLAAALEKLYNHSIQNKMIANNNEKELLPNRKLDFHEVRKLLNEQISPSGSNLEQVNKDVLKETQDKRKILIKKIEIILQDINETAERGEIPRLMIKNQRLWSNCIYDLDRVTLKSNSDAKKSIIHYSKDDDKTRFNAIILVLTKVHELLTKNIIVTRREMFYQNVVRFRNQSNLDVAVRDVCCLLECPPWDLGLIATAKGLIAGPLTIESSDGTIIDCMLSGGILIPQNVTGIKILKSSAKYILVVEKDAIFQKLLDEGALLRLGPVIIMTGKGYPDVCTRQMLVRLVQELHLRALALVDADPHGYEIFLTYKYGSLALSHLSSSLACTSLSLLGARFHDIQTLAPANVRLILTERDRCKLNSLMKRPYLNTPKGQLIKQELLSMLSSGVKAELEGLAPTGAALCDAYLPAKIIQGEYIG